MVKSKFYLIPPFIYISKYQLSDTYQQDMEYNISCLWDTFCTSPSSNNHANIHKTIFKDYIIKMQASATSHE